MKAPLSCLVVDCDKPHEFGKKPPAACNCTDPTSEDFDPSTQNKICIPDCEKKLEFGQSPPAECNCAKIILDGGNPPPACTPNCTKPLEKDEKPPAACKCEEPDNMELPSCKPFTMDLRDVYPIFKQLSN